MTIDTFYYDRKANQKYLLYYNRNEYLSTQNFIFIHFQLEKRKYRNSTWFQCCVEHFYIHYKKKKKKILTIYFKFRVQLYIIQLLIMFIFIN